MADTKKTKKSRIKGFTLIEALTLIFIFCIITLSFYNVISVGIKYIQDSKNRLLALSIANEKMETVRNMKYENIGTQGGEVSGDIPQEEDVIRGSHEFTVNTLVEYVMDPYDGLNPGDDPAFEDFKKVTIEVFWGKVGVNQPKVKLVSRFVPQGLEVANPGDGILSINIFSDQPGGTGISGSTVHVVNAETGLNTTKQTDSSGNVVLIGDTITDSIQKYEISVSKSDYESVSTLPPYPISSFLPTFTHASVVTGSVNVANIVQNELSDLKVATVNYLNEPIGNINFHLTGGKMIGKTAALPNDPIYNLDTDGKTGDNGEKEFLDISPGQYTFTLSSSVTEYKLVGIDPVSPLYLYSGNPLTLKVKLAPKNVSALSVSVQKSDDDQPISGAQVKVTNELGYDVTQTTGSDGKVFFPNTADLFQSGAYSIKVTAEGFQEGNLETNVSAGSLKMETVKLNSL